MDLDKLSGFLGKFFLFSLVILFLIHNFWEKKEFMTNYLSLILDCSMKTKNNEFFHIKIKLEN